MKCQKCHVRTVLWHNSSLIWRLGHLRCPADMGMAQSRVMSRLRVKCFSFESWADSNRKVGKHFESWVNLWVNLCSLRNLISMDAAPAVTNTKSSPNQYLGMRLSCELILSQFLENQLSHELNRFNTARYCLSDKLIRIKVSYFASVGKTLEWKARKRLHQVK